MSTSGTGGRDALVADAVAQQEAEVAAAEASSSEPMGAPETPRILVVDDEKVIREILSDFLTMEGYVVHTVEDGDEALKELHRRSYNLVISDLKMPDMGGLELLEKITEESLPVLTVIMTGFGTVETAIEAMKKGAYDYILKPFKVEEVVHVVQRGLDRQRLQHENIRLKEALSIYKITEAIATSLSVDTVLDLVLDATIDAVDADVVSLLLEDPQHGAASSSARARSRSAPSPNIAGARAQPRRGAAAVSGGPPAARARQPVVPLPRVAARSRAAARELLRDPAQAQGPHHRHAQRVQLHARQQVHRGPAQDALRARRAARRSRSRTRACTRTSSTPTRTSRAPTSRSRRTSSRPSSASRTRSRSPTATRAATPSASRSTRASSPWASR